MNCRYSENDIALFVERDIASPQACEIEEHLAICDACRELAQDLQETQSVFKSLKRDSVSAGALASVRTKVLAEVGGRSVRPAWGRWVYALAGVAFVAVMVIGMAQYGRKPVAQVQQIVKSDPPLSPDASPYLARASRAAVPLTRGTITTTGAIPAAVIKRAKVNKVNVTVPRTEGDSRPRSGRQGVAQAEVSAEPPKQLVVKLLTDDPNIVIYWLVDQNGGRL
jgi:hypothetical protein